MTSIYERRKNTLISLGYFAVILTVFYLFMKYAFWFLSPFIFALAVAVLLQKPVNAIHKKTKIKKGAISAVTLILFLLIAVGLLSLLSYKLFTEFSEFANNIATKFEDMPELIGTLNRWAKNVVSVLPGPLKETANEAVASFFTRCSEYAENEVGLAEMMEFMGFSFSNISEKLSNSSVNISEIASPILSTAVKLPSMVVSVIIFVIACFFLTAGYDDLVLRLKGAVKKETAAKLSTVKRVTLTSLGQMAKSYAFILCITFAELVVSLNILQLIGVYTGGFIIVISLCTALLDILPVLGTGTVMIPWALYNLLIAKNPKLGIGLLVIYALITVIRQIIEPKLVGANLGLPSILTLFGMYVGAETIGFMGLFVVPISFVIVKMLNDDGVIHLWGEEKELATEEITPESEPEEKPFAKKRTRVGGKNKAKGNADGTNEQKNGNNAEKND